MIAEVVRQKAVFHPNIRILANDMFFDEVSSHRWLSPLYADNLDMSTVLHALWPSCPGHLVCMASA